MHRRKNESYEDYRKRCNEYAKKWIEVNKEHYLEQQRKCRDKNREQRNEHRRSIRKKANKDWYDKRAASYYKKYCDDFVKIENYEKAKADNFTGWVIHHKLETHTSDGERRMIDLKVAELKALDMYYHRPASELIFMTRAEHVNLHRRDFYRDN